MATLLRQGCGYCLVLFCVLIVLKFSAAFKLFSSSEEDANRLSKRSITTCPYGFTHDIVGDRCYWVTSAPADREEANKMCAKAGYGAKLAVVTDDAMRQGLIRFVRRLQAEVNDTCLCEFGELCFVVADPAANGCPSPTTKLLTTSTTTKKGIYEKLVGVAVGVPEPHQRGRDSTTPCDCNTTEPWCTSVHQNKLWIPHPCHLERCALCQVEPHEDWGDMAWSHGHSVKEGAKKAGEEIKKAFTKVWSWWGR